MKTSPHARLHKSIKAVKIWAGADLPTEPQRIDDYIQGNEIIALACAEILRIGMNQIGKSLTLSTPNHNPVASKMFAAAATKILASQSIIIKNMSTTKQTHYQDLDGITHIIFCALASGQLSLIPALHRAVIDGLENGYGITDGHDLPIGTTLRYAAFGMTVIGDWLDKPFDVDKHGLPRDPAWGQLVAHWREPDPEKLLPILLAACDVHVERIALTSREVDTGQFEFGSTFEAVYPAEILAIINLRRSLGLPTPFIDHPLMKTPYAALTLPPNTRLEPDELLENFLKAACRLNPEAVPEGLYETVMQSFDRG